MQGIYRKLARSPGSSVMALGVLFSVATVALFLGDLQTRYSDRIATAKKDARSFADVLAEDTALTFEDVDRVLRQAEAVRETSRSGRFDPAVANDALRRLQESSSILVGIGWTDASGEMLANSFGDKLPRKNISDLRHFTGQRDGIGDRLLVTPPFLSPTSDKWFTGVSLRLNNADGSFAGVVTAAIDQSYFTNLYRSIDLGKGGTIFLAHREGRLLAREPEQKDAIGKLIADGPLYTKYLPAAEEGTYEAASIVDGLARVVAYKAIPGLPLIVAVSYARSEILAPWYRHLYTFGPPVAAIVAVILFGTLLLVRQANALAAKGRILAETNARFNAAISNMSQGLCLFDADKRLVISNKRYQEMYGLPDGLVLRGTPLSRILQFYEDRGDIGITNVDTQAGSIPVEQEQTYEPGDGRKIFIQRQPLPDGGWVATHTDVTEQKRGEQLLAGKAAELEAINVRFDAALNNMSQGLCMFDAEQRVVVSNARYGEIYHLGRDQISPGTTLAQILEYRREKGTNFSIPPEEYLRRKVRNGREVQDLADGRVVAIARHIMPDGGWLTTHADITERARSEKRIAFLAQYDLLTGLANRALFSERLEEAAKRQQRHGSDFSVLMLDLDRFKAVNDTLGHPAGDRLLVEVAQRLKSSIRDVDVVARLGGDEFAIIQENEKSQCEGAIALSLRIIELIERPFDIDGHQVGIGTSIGIAFAPEHGSDPETLLRKADLALYAAKSSGRNDFRIFQPEFIQAADTQKSKEGELRAALSGNEFELHYQPVIDVKTRRVCGVEAFVRWHHPSRGLLAPAEFLPLAESSGLMLPLGGWILQQACLDAAAWPPHVKLAVNISAAQFSNGSLFELIVCALAESGLWPERLELEIADASLLEEDRQVHLHTIRQLKNLGVSIVLDNCGTGYSSAAYLASFPFDKIKIDRAITEGLTRRRDCAAVVASVLALAHGLGIATAAKGVESAEQFEALQAAGVDFAQGYLFGRPVPHSELDLDVMVLPVRDVA
jgi:diguanylate cyclase (GGDEF)-like protein